MIHSKIQDGEGTKEIAGVKRTETFGNGLKTYTYDGNPLELGTTFFNSETYGADLNQDASFGGTPDAVHDGIDTVLWTGSAISGTWTFNDTTYAHAGTRSVDCSATVNGNVAQFAKGSALTVANYTAITGWIYITGWSTSGTKAVNIYTWDGATAAAVSDLINIGNYIDTTSFGVWQQFNIPFTDLNITTSTFDNIRIQTVDIGGGPPPDYWLDDIQVEETGGGFIFSAGPDSGEVWYVNTITYILTDAYAGTVTGGTMPSIPYDGFLGVNTLSAGTIVRRIQFNEVRFSSTFNDFIDYLATAAPKKIISGSDGTNTWLRLEAHFPDPVILDGTKGDRYEIVVNDDLTGLLYYRASLTYGVATIQIP